MNFKRAKVVMLPTNNEVIRKGDLIKAIVECTNPVIKKGELAVAAYSIESKLQSGWESQHLYILSDDEIEVGDWCLNKVSKTVFEGEQELIDLINSPNIELTTNKKVIATTDPNLKLPTP